MEISLTVGAPRLPLLPFFAGFCEHVLQEDALGAKVKREDVPSELG